MFWIFRRLAASYAYVLTVVPLAATVTSRFHASYVTAYPEVGAAKSKGTGPLFRRWGRLNGPVPFVLPPRLTLRPHGAERPADLIEQHGDLFPVRFRSVRPQWNRWDLQGRDGGMMTAGVGGALSGKTSHLMIIDDPTKNDEEARSPRHREKQWEWWQSVATTHASGGGLGSW